MVINGQMGLVLGRVSGGVCSESGFGEEGKGNHRKHRQRLN